MILSEPGFIGLRSCLSLVLYTCQHDNIATHVLAKPAIYHARLTVFHTIGTCMYNNIINEMPSFSIFQKMLPLSIVLLMLCILSEPSYLRGPMSNTDLVVGHLGH